MSKIRENIISNCEKKFLTKCLSEWNRIDGRTFDEFREIKIEFGKDWGSCYVSLGQTQVLAQVSCEIQVPKSTRPSEGILYINLELNPLAAPNFEPGRQSDLSVQLNRLLEKCIKDSKAVDLESLCIKVNEKVWALRVDVNVLNHEGNILDCASIAALTALAHFRRPDVTCDGEDIVVHTYAQRDSIPTVIHHYPICISFAIFSNGEVILADPTLLEEGVSEACLSIGLNAYKELCGFHLGGSALMSPDVILKTIQKAGGRALKVIEQIKGVIEEDTTKRQDNKDIGFQQSRIFDKDVSMARENLTQCLDRWVVNKSRRAAPPPRVETMETGEEHGEPAKVETLGNQSAVLLPPENGNNPWVISSDEPSDGDDDVAVISENPSHKDSTSKDNQSDGSEEESIVVLNADLQTNKKKRKHKK